MHYYVYDTILDQKECRKRAVQIETQINNMGLSGERGLANSLRNINDLVRDAVDKNFESVIVVGDDSSFSSALNALALTDCKMTLGFLPVRPRQVVAGLLGVEPESAAVSLSRQVTRDLRLAKANNSFFLSEFSCKPAQTKSDNAATKLLQRFWRGSNLQLNLELVIDGRIKISVETKSLRINYDPSRDQLRISIANDSNKKSMHGEYSTLWGNTIVLSQPKGSRCVADGSKITGNPIEIKLTDKKIPLVVGRRREFN